MSGRFVVLRHELPTGHERPSHWDLLLEAGEVLRAWALAAPPQLGSVTTAIGLPDHRRTYLNYEGPVSGGRGTVARHDAGQFRWLRDEPATVEVQLVGSAFQGIVRLSRDGGGWQVTFRMLDPPTCPGTPGAGGGEVVDAGGDEVGDLRRAR